MEELMALVRVVSQQRVRKIDLFSENTSIPFKSKELFEKIRSGEITSEKEAYNSLYKGKEKRQAFNKLKNRLVKRLLNTLIFIDFKKHSSTSYQHALFKVSKNWVLIKILLDRTERKTAMRLAEKTFNLSKKHEMTEFSLLIGRELYRHYSYLQPNRGKLQKITLEIEKLKKVLDAELLSEQYYCLVSKYEIVDKGGFGAKKLELLGDMCSELRAMQKTIRSYRFNLETYQLLSFYYFKSNDFQEALNISQEALQFFKQKPFDDKVSKVIIRNDIISSSIQLDKFDIAEKNILENLSIVTPNSFAWFRVMNFYFLLLSFTERYNDMLEITSKVTHSPQFKTYNIHYQAWLIKEAYIHFLIKTKKIDNDIYKKYPLKNFRLNRFLNEVPLYSKDKRGFNISILIIQMLFLIEQQKFNLVIDRIDALKQYSYRYLRNDSSFRSNCFIKMLVKIPELGFHPVRVQAHVKTLYNKLKSVPLGLSDQSSEIEVLPYEILWDLVVELLVSQK